MLWTIVLCSGTAVLILFLGITTNSQVLFTILGGIISAAVGAGLFFLQRFLQQGDEQEKILFKIYQLMAIVPVPGTVGDPHQIDVQIQIHELANEQEIHTLATRIKDEELAIEILSYKRWRPGGNKALMDKIAERLNPKLVKKVEETNKDRSKKD